MYRGKTILGIIPARGGSKSIPRKNIKSLGGKPLIVWTIEEAKKSGYIDRLILSSEDREIIALVKPYGCEVPFVRPVELAQDDTPGIAPVLHALEALPEKYDYVVLLQPTSPLRKKEDINECIERCIEQNLNSCVSICETEKSPYWMYTLGDTGAMEPVIKTNKKYDRRQDLPKVYAINGAVYVARIEWLICSKSFVGNDTSSYIMPRERSVDIDTEFDFKFAEYLLLRT